MVMSAQYNYGRPGGISKKKGRYAPIIEEQAKQGLATKMVTEGKARKQAQEEWEFNKASTEKSLALQKQQADMQKKQNKFNQYMGWANLGVNALSTGVELVDTILSWG